MNTTTKNTEGRGGAGCRIGIYNEFWNAFGGGEIRALHFAAALAPFGTVELISGTAFDVDALKRRFALRLDHVVSRVIPGISSRDTADYDLLVNASYQSDLEMRSRCSLLLLSFPHKTISAAALASYDAVLATSRYASDWTQRYWPKGPETIVLYPPIVSAQRPPSNKSRTIVSIGRFFQGGHGKKHVEMIEAFKRLQLSHAPAKPWQLVLLGSCNLRDAGSVMYLQAVQRHLAGWRIRVIPNAPRKDLDAWLDASAIYWHAAGLGVGTDEPEKLEHFGISVVEAMDHGCVPIVYAHGGPRESIGDDASLNRLCFEAGEGLVQSTSDAIETYESDPAAFDALRRTAMSQARRFSVARHDRQVVEILQKLQPLGITAISGHGLGRADDEFFDRLPSTNRAVKS
jgi:glycosyltransferase involved in cell wall biosynthesis